MENILSATKEDFDSYLAYCRTSKSTDANPIPLKEYIQKLYKKSESYQVSMDRISIIGTKGKDGSYQDYHDLDFSDVSFKDANFENINFKNCSFKTCNMQNIRMVNCNFHFVDMSNSNLTDALIAGGEPWEKFSHDMNKFFKSPMVKLAQISTGIATVAGISSELSSAATKALMSSTVNQLNQYVVAVWPKPPIVPPSVVVTNSIIKAAPIVAAKATVAAITIAAGITLIGAVCNGIKLIGIDFKDTKIRDCDFSGAFMSNVSFSKCSIENTKIDKSKITNIKLQDTEFLKSSFSDSEIYNLDISSKYTLKECFNNSKIITKLKDLSNVVQEKYNDFTEKLKRKRSETTLNKANRMV